MAAAFSATVVTYRPDAVQLASALASLRANIDEARGRGLVSEAAVFIVDNTPGAAPAGLERPLSALDGARIVRGHGNVGYGRANNLVLEELRSDVHLVMNPDVELEPGALAAALEAMRDDPSIGIVAPAVRDAGGALGHLCKRYPSVWVLLLRGFAPGFVRKAFARSLDDYEMRDLPPDRRSPVPLASGCFMLVRTALFKRLGGFDPRFFMYFEDYDLSLRAAREAQVSYVPAARIVHHGGDAAAKGPRHVAWFLASAWRFFARHGWRIA